MNLKREVLRMLIEGLTDEEIAKETDTMIATANLVMFSVLSAGGANVEDRG